LEKALALDPNLAVAAAHLVGNRTEEGKLVQAYQDAAKLVKRRPENAQAHFNLGYVLRYAGLLEESEHECEAAVAVDPGNYQLRSCALAYMQSGNSDRAKEFIRLDTGSEWANFTTYIMLLRENKIEEARLAIRQAPTNPYYHRDVLEACLQPAPAAGFRPHRT
jgi:tetratricopeptide (TPR) repeat protein